MTRIPYVRREELAPEDRQQGGGRVSNLGELIVTADGGLAGPFNAFVTAPAAGRRLSSGHVDQETYDAEHCFLGDAGMVELASPCGYYTLISFLLNAFAVPLPPDGTPMWAGS
jgi:hypothetical protein